MKKLILTSAFALCSLIGIAQHELKLNFFNVIAIGSVELGYEYLLDDNQSIGFGLLINDRYNYRSETSAREFDTNSFFAAYNFYVSGSDNTGLVISPQAKVRFGDYTRSDGRKVDMDSFSLGAGLGYKWIFEQIFTIGPEVYIGRNFSDDVRREFEAIEFNVGVNIGVRF